MLQPSCEKERLQWLWVDQGYSGAGFAHAITEIKISGAQVEVIKRTQAGFLVLPRPWVVERTFGCLGRYRRLSKDDELLPEVSEAMIYGAMIRLMLHRVVSSGSLYKSALTARQFATILKVSPNRINQILKGKRDITPDTALRIGQYLGTGAHIWLDLQMEYNLYKIDQEIGEHIRAIVPERQHTST